MALSWERYLECVDSFLKVSSLIGDGWVIIVRPPESEKLPENCYLMKKVNAAKPCDQNSASGSELYEEEMEPDELSFQDSSSSSSETLFWEYHILYSPSYSVPVLYFNVRNSAGKLIRLEELWNSLNVPKEVLSEKWSFVTQQEHPILLRPFFHLHPCKSFEFLKISENSSINPLVTWLSSISPLVNLSVSLEYGKQNFSSKKVDP